jgi:RNA polymerase sigma-70 factor, ECF subfamily
MTNAQQFEAFMSNYQDMVFSTALRLTANRSEAQDIAQEVFLRAFQHFEELQHSPTAGGWLRTVATNLSLNHLSRYRSRWSFFSELAANREGEPAEVQFSTNENLEADLEMHDRHEIVERALRSLPPAQRIPMVLYHLEGLKYEEIAEKMHISIGKVKTDIFRGREALRKKLRIHLPEVFERAT